ncbi:MAG: hypothetical protein WCX69_01135 [Candidatus Paceibacterota bacterium]
MDISALEKVIFPPETGAFLAAKIFFILFDLGVIAFIIYVWVTTIYLRRLWIIDLVEFFTYRSFTSRAIDNDWIKIKKRLLTQRGVEFKLAVVDADLLVNDVLTRAGYEGKTLADKLQKRPDIFSDPEAMIEADWAYQNIVNDSKFSLDYPQAKKIILTFEQCLKDVAAFRDK